jgi:hypothetical protein
VRIKASRAGPVHIRDPFRDIGGVWTCGGVRQAPRTIGSPMTLEFTLRKGETLVGRIGGLNFKIRLGARAFLNTPALLAT